MLDFVAAMERCSVRDAALKLQDWFAVEPTRAPRGQAGCPSEGPPSALTVAEENKPLGFMLRNVDLHHPYLTERGVDWKTAVHFGIGFYPGKGFMQGRIVIPVHNRGGW